MRLGVLQMDCVEGNPARNHRLVAQAVVDAREDGVELLVLPELWRSGYDLAASTGEEGLGDAFADVSALSREVPLLAGSLLEPHLGRHRNCALATAEGAEVRRYRKRHLFRPLGEDEHLIAGEEDPAVFEIAGVRAAFAVCYDLRFPELFVPLSTQGVELVCVPAQWPRARIGHWRALLVARAIECQCWVVGVNRLGWFGDLEFPGHSLVVDPRGGIVLDCGEEPGLHTVDVDPGEVHAWRSEFPVR